LRINLNRFIYGTFAEIGAGQEVARHFFRAGGASGTSLKPLVHMTRTLVIIFMAKKTTNAM
jgi:hypothetical protein